MATGEVGGRSNKKDRFLPQNGVGTYDDRKRQNLNENGFQISRVNPQNIASAPFRETKASNGIEITLPEPKRPPIRITPRDPMKLLRPDYDPNKVPGRNTGYNTESALLESIRSPCQKSPYIRETSHRNPLKTKTSTITCDEEKPIPRIPFYIKDTEDVLKYGNCVKNLPSEVREFLEGGEQGSSHSGHHEDLCGKHVVHRDFDPFTGRPRILVLHIEFDHSETDEEESDDHVTIITTYYYISFLRYE